MKFVKVLVLGVALLGSSAWSIDLGALAAGFRGQNLQQCMNTCRPGDGQCYQGCNAVYGNPQPSQHLIQLQQQQPRQIDYTCMSGCTSSNIAYGLCERRCSY